MEYFQTGDVLYFANAEIPKDAKADLTGVIIKSPTTGHAHCVMKPGVVMRSGDKAFISSSEPFLLGGHAEHFDMPMDAGNYEIRTPLEYDHMLQESRAVID